MPISRTRPRARLSSVQTLTTRSPDSETERSADGSGPVLPISAPFAALGGDIA